MLGKMEHIQEFLKSEGCSASVSTHVSGAETSATVELVPAVTP